MSNTWKHFGYLLSKLKKEKRSCTDKKQFKDSEKHLSSQDTFEIGHLKLQQPKVQIIHV